MKNNKEKKQKVITGKKVVNIISIFAGIVGAVFLVTNLMGITDLDWFAISLCFISPILVIMSKSK